MKKVVCMVCAGLGVLVLLAGGGLRSLGFPSKPVTVIVPAPPGGTADISMYHCPQTQREPRAADRRGQSTGCRGIIASQLALKATPDGYTVLMNYTSHAINPSLYKKLPYDTAKDFTPVTFSASRASFPSSIRVCLRRRLRVNRVRQGQPRQAELRLRGHRRSVTPGRGVAEDQGRNRHRPCSLQRRGCGCCGPDERSDSDANGQPAAASASHQGG